MEIKAESFSWNKSTHEMRTKLGFSLERDDEGAEGPDVKSVTLQVATTARLKYFNIENG